MSLSLYLIIRRREAGSPGPRSLITVALVSEGGREAPEEGAWARMEKGGPQKGILRTPPFLHPKGLQGPALLAPAFQAPVPQSQNWRSAEGYQGLGSGEP